MVDLSLSHTRTHAHFAHKEKLPLWEIVAVPPPPQSVISTQMVTIDISSIFNLSVITKVMQKQNHGVLNGAYGYSNKRFGNVDGSNMNWEPTNPSSGYSHGYCYGSSSSDAAPAIPTACNNDYLRVQALPGHPNNVPIAGKFPRRKKPCLDTRGRICTVCRSTSTPLWRNGPRGAKVIDP